MTGRLMFALFFVIATTMMGSAIVAVLTMQFDTGKPIMIAAAAGFVVALPVTWLVSRQITKLRQ